VEATEAAAANASERLGTFRVAKVMEGARLSPEWEGGWESTEEAAEGMEEVAQGPGEGDWRRWEVSVRS
jgi:hypothetical protein